MLENHNASIITHEYDLDTVATYYRLSELEFTRENIIHKELYLERIKKEVETFCTNSVLNFSFYFDNKLPIIIPSTTVNFEWYIGLHLISYDIPKIGAFLSYQKSIYDGKHDFVNLVEFLIYGIVKSNSPIDNIVRLEKIIQWVTQERLLGNAGYQKTNKTVSASSYETGKGNQHNAKTLQYALFHYYKQNAGYAPLFEHVEGETKKGAMKKQGNEYQVSQNNFMNLSYDVAKKSIRVVKKNIDHLEIVVQMLSDCPKAQELAKKDLNEAKVLP